MTQAELAHHPVEHTSCSLACHFDSVENEEGVGARPVGGGGGGGGRGGAVE